MSFTGRGNRHDDEHLKQVFSGKNIKGVYWGLIGASVFITGFGFGIDWLFSSLLPVCDFLEWDIRIPEIAC